MGMKKGARIAALALAAILLGACGKDGSDSGTEQTQKQSESENRQAATEPATEEDTQNPVYSGNERGLLHPIITSRQRAYYNDAGITVETAECESIAFGEEEAEAYPALSAAIREQFEKEESAFFSEAEELRDEAEEYVREMGTDGGSYYGMERSVELYRCDSGVFSFSVFDYQFTGGVHGNYGYGGYSYDTGTGKLLTAEDIFADRQELAEAIVEILDSAYSPDAFFDREGLLDAVMERINSGSLNVVLTNRGPRVIFNPYEIGPYAAGVLVANLYPEYYPDLVKPEYARIPESWIVRLPANENLHVDVDGDSLPEDIRYSERIEYADDYSYSEITGFDVFAGADQLFIPADAYASEAYFVRKQGSSFLYIFYRTDNDYQVLKVIDLTDRKLAYDEESCSLSAAVASVSRGDDYDGDPSVWDGYRSSYSLTDPENMYLESWTDFLSTAMGVRLMHAGENGVPVPNEGYELYRIEYFANDFTALRDVRGTLIDNAGNEAGEYTIPAGATVRYIRTDNETFGDVRTADGRIVRLYMNRESWPYTIDGVSLEDLFDGIIFAG